MCVNFVDMITTVTLPKYKQQGPFKRLMWFYVCISLSFNFNNNIAFLNDPEHV